MRSSMTSPCCDMRKCKQPMTVCTISSSSGMFSAIGPVFGHPESTCSCTPTLS